MIIALAATADIKEDSDYYKTQCVMYTLNKIEIVFQDRTAQLTITDNSELKQIKYARAIKYTEEVEELFKHIEDIIRKASKKNGKLHVSRKEE